MQQTLSLQASDERHAGVCQGGVQWARRRHPCARCPQWQDLRLQVPGPGVQEVELPAAQGVAVDGQLAAGQALCQGHARCQGPPQLGESASTCQIPSTLPHAHANLQGTATAAFAAKCVTALS